MFGDLVRLAFFLKERADLRLLTGFLYIIFIAPFNAFLVVWCHLAQLHQVSHCASGDFVSPTGVSEGSEMGLAAIKPNLIASSRFSSFPRKSIN